jgi:hypothetical protein
MNQAEDLAALDPHQSIPDIQILLLKYVLDFNFKICVAREVHHPNAIKWCWWWNW